ncbi:MAG: discoidin domain-containing protein, partial [Phycisphaerales bacterium]|nr:discoidin domain-containing protein [Phycisphaerales bacterium]
WAQFYWHHIARRQTGPMNIHGFDLTDPIRQFNDYGYLMCSTISGTQCSTWNYMGYPCRFWDINGHTVSDVWYDGRFHHYDNSVSAHYTLEDGVTIAGVPDIGRKGVGPETDGEAINGYIGKYKCVNATGPASYIEGADTERPLVGVAEKGFKLSELKYRFYLYEQDRGHRYSLNLRDGEVYTRYYRRQDIDSPNAVKQVHPRNNSDYKSDPAYFVPNRGWDPEVVNARYRIRGNGERTWKPFSPFLGPNSNFVPKAFPKVFHGWENISSDHESDFGSSMGARFLMGPRDKSKPGVAIFKVEGANVITSLKLSAELGIGDGGSATVAISTNNGMTWKEVWKSSVQNIAQHLNDLKLINEVNGSYEVLVKITLNNASLSSDLSFNTITAINSKAQPMLKIGKNTVYVGNGDQSGSIVFWPQLHDDAYKPYAFEASNVRTQPKEGFKNYFGSIFPDDSSKDGYVVFKIDAPSDLTSVTYGGRFYNREPNARIDLLHSFDGGKSWAKSLSFTDTNPPWDVVQYVTVNDIPAGSKSVLFKYLMNCPTVNGAGGPNVCGIYAVRMEANHKLAAPSNGPVEVTFNWSERQVDYSLVKRSHTQLVDKLPATYTINVGGADHPVVDSLTVNLKGARKDVKYGYFDDKDVGGDKWTGVWATYGKNLAAHKPYTVSVKPLDSKTVWGANDDSGKRLTDTFVGSSYNGGVNYKDGAMWTEPVDITVDLGEAQACQAFRMHIYGRAAQDAIKGEVKDKVEVLTSLDGENFTSAGNFDFNLRWKDVPENYMWTDEETFNAHVHTLPLKEAVNARYVKFKVVPSRTMGISEVMVLDGYKFDPFDMRIALPDPASNGKAPPNAGVSPNVRKWGPDEKQPQTIGKPWKAGGNNVDD